MRKLILLVLLFVPLTAVADTAVTVPCSPNCTVSNVGYSIVSIPSTVFTLWTGPEDQVPYAPYTFGVFYYDSVSAPPPTTIGLTQITDYWPAYNISPFWSGYVLNDAELWVVKQGVALFNADPPSSSDPPSSPAPEASTLLTTLSGTVFLSYFFRTMMSSK